MGTYVPLGPDNVSWGYLPNRDATPIRRVRSGALVTFDTVSHEGILEDQDQDRDRDPDRYFASKGVREDQILRDTRAIVQSDLEHDFDRAGPHIVSGPVEVAGAEPGDVLRVDVVGLVPRIPYGVVSNRHGKGALPGEYPRRRGPSRARAPSGPSSTTTSPCSPPSAGSAGSRAVCSRPAPATGSSSRPTPSWRSWASPSTPPSR